MASKRNIRRRACEGKARYSTQEEARNTLKLYASRGWYTGAMHPYKCKFCHGWHCGHAPHDQGYGFIQGAQHHDVVRVS